MSDVKQSPEPLSTIGITPAGLTVYVDGKPSMSIPTKDFPLLILRLAKAMQETVH